MSKAEPAVAARADDTFAVGQVLPLEHAPPVRGLRALAALVEGDIPAAAAERLRDPRIPAEQWPQVLKREVAMTLGWAARRIRARATGAAGPPPAWHGRGRVLVLLPAHGLAVHALRRALPFALCGLPTTVVGHERDRDAVAEVLAALRDLTGLTPAQLSPAADTAPRAVRAAVPDDLVVLTGNPRTAETVRRESPALVLGATGGCTVLVGADPEQARRTAALLREHDRPGSCTRLHSWRVVPGSCAGGPGAPEPLGAVHPSAVYRLGAAPDRPIGTEDGYVVLPCDASGAVGTLTGFARDPLHRWPGDFLV
jgi:hypothetical protein